MSEKPDKKQFQGEIQSSETFAQTQNIINLLIGLSYSPEFTIYDNPSASLQILNLIFKDTIIFLVLSLLDNTFAILRDSFVTRVYFADVNVSATEKHLLR